MRQDLHPSFRSGYLYLSCKVLSLRFISFCHTILARPFADYRLHRISCCRVED